MQCLNLTKILRENRNPADHEYTPEPLINETEEAARDRATTAATAWNCPLWYADFIAHHIQRLSRDPAYFKAFRAAQAANPPAYSVQHSTTRATHTRTSTATRRADNRPTPAMQNLIDSETDRAASRPAGSRERNRPRQHTTWREARPRSNFTPLPNSDRLRDLHKQTRAQATASLVFPEACKSALWAKAQINPAERDLWDTFKKSAGASAKASPLPWPSMEPGTMPIGIRFARTQCTLAQQDGIPLFPADYHEIRQPIAHDGTDERIHYVLIHHLIYADNLTPFEFDVIGSYAERAADLLNITANQDRDLFELHEASQCV